MVTTKFIHQSIGRPGTGQCVHVLNVHQMYFYTKLCNLVHSTYLVQWKSMYLPLSSPKV